MNIISIFRHWFTLFATAATLWLIGAFALSADEGKTLSDAFGQLLEPLVIIGTLLITAAWRIALTWLSKIFRDGTGEGNETTGNGGPGGALLLILGTAVVGLGSLPSCNAIAGLPLKATVQLEEGALSYSSKGGLEMEYRPGYGRMPEVYRGGSK